MGLYLVMKNNIKRFLRKRSFWFGTMIIPLCIVLYCTISKEVKEDIKYIGVLTSDQTQYSEAVKTERAGIIIKRADERTIKTDLIQNKYDYVIDQTRSLSTGGKVVRSIKEIPVIKSAGQKDTKAEPILGVVMTIMMMLGGIYVSKMISDRKNGVQERYQAAGGSVATYIAGYGASAFTLIMMQVIVILMAVMMMTEIHLSVIAIISLAVMIGAVAGVCGVLFCLIGKTDMVSNILNSSFASLAALFGGIYFTLEQMPFVIQIIGWLSPVRWIIELYSKYLG